MSKKVADACFLVSAVRSTDIHHTSCYEYLKSHEGDQWFIPAIAYFEYQAVQSCMHKRGDGSYRGLYLPEHWEIYDINTALIRKSTPDIVSLFPDLKGADLIYACICYVEKIPLVTCDFDFDVYSRLIEIINPLRDGSGQWGGQIEITTRNNRFQGHYKVHGVLPLITVRSGKASTTTQLGGSPPKSLARILLRELAEAGRAQHVGKLRDS